MLESQVLKFGEFTLKSGRKSPFFMNAGAYVTGDQLHRLGLYYAKAINDNFGLDFDVVFGPAYKGIPLSVVTAMGLQELYGKEVKYCSNRKEAKDHGEGGTLLGYTLQDGDRVLEALKDECFVEQAPKTLGRVLGALIGPPRKNGPPAAPARASITS